MSDLIPVTVPLSIAEDTANISLEVAADAQQIPLEVGMAITPVSGEPYDGLYTITPAGVRQTIPAAGLYAREDFIVEAIPNNYGLITWDGSVLTVA